MAVPSRDVVSRDIVGRDVTSRDGDDESVKDILTGITQDARDFVSLEFETLKLDLRQELQEAKKAAIAGVAGAAVLYLGAIVLLLALAHLLGEAMPLWAGHAIVGIVVCGVGAGLLFMAKSKGEKVVVPPPAIEDAKEDIRWIKESTSG